MRAVFIEEFGGPEKVRVGERPEPKPGPGEVLLRVKSAALNHLDVWVRRGRPGLTLDQPHVLGSDAAGVIEAVGEGAEEVAPGDEVVFNPGLSCMRCEYCRRGAHSECPRYQLRGFQLAGTYAEKIAVPMQNVAPKPKHLNWDEAAALTLSHLTAWHMLFPRARFRQEETVLIHGIGGGVALAALQLARLAGGEAIVTSSSDEKIARAKEMGARAGVNYRTGGELGAKVRELTGGRGVDVVFDSVGAPTLPLSMAALRRGGRIVICGVTGGHEGRLNLQNLYWNHISLIGSTMGSLEDFRALTSAINRARITPVVDRVFPLEDYAEAVRRMEAGEQFGKIVLRVSA